MKNSLDSKLQIYYVCSIGIPSRIRDKSKKCQKLNLASERALERSRSPDVSIDCVFLFLSFSFLIFDIGGAGAFFYNINASVNASYIRAGMSMHNTKYYIRHFTAIMSTRLCFSFIPYGLEIRCSRSELSKSLERIPTEHSS